MQEEEKNGINGMEEINGKEVMEELDKLEDDVVVIKSIEDGQPQEKKVRPEFILKFLIIATMVTVGIYLVFYFSVVYGSKKIAMDVAKVYANGTGEELAELYAPGYVAFFEEEFSYTSFIAGQEQYLNAFRTELQPYVGEIQRIDVKINTLFTASNIADFEENFEVFGVHGVSKYKQVDMTWKVTGSSGAKEIGAQAFVFKCDDGWCLDYILFSYEQK